MNIEPGLTFQERQIVRGNAYGLAICLVPLLYLLWKPSTYLIVEEWEPRGTSEPWSWIRSKWMEVEVVDSFTEIERERLYASISKKSIRSSRLSSLPQIVTNPASGDTPTDPWETSSQQSCPFRLNAVDLKNI